MARSPDNATARRHFASCLGMPGRTEEAREALNEYRRLEPGHTLEDIGGRVPARNPADLDRFIDGLRRAGWQD